jgi:hypothetical protein
MAAESERSEVPEEATTEEQTPGSSDARPPWLLGVVAVALVLGGYQLLNYAPPPRDTEQVQFLERLKIQAADDPALSERLRQIEVPSSRPYKAAGTIAIYGGLLLFIAAGIKMYHHRPPTAEIEGPDEPES